MLRATAGRRHLAGGGRRAAAGVPGLPRQRQADPGLQPGHLSGGRRHRDLRARRGQRRSVDAALGQRSRRPASPRRTSSSSASSTSTASWPTTSSATSTRTPSTATSTTTTRRRTARPSCRGWARSTPPAWPPPPPTASSSPDALKATIEAGPYSADEAKAKGLIDNVGEEKEAEDAILKARRRRRQARRLRRLRRSRAKAASASFAAAPTIALIQAEGDIVTGTGGHGSPLGGGARPSTPTTSPRPSTTRSTTRTSKPSSSASTRPAAPTPPRRRSSRPCARPRRPASRWWSAWATTAPRAATGSRRRPTRSSPSRRR